MRRKSVFKTLALMACVVLMQSMIAFADELPVVDETVGVETVETVQTEEIAEAESTEEIEETVETETEVVEEETEVPEESVTPTDTPRIMYGTVTDSLSKQGDYKIYPVPCLQNMYLQAELFIDTNARVDYDLYLIDENFNIITGCDYLANNNGGKRYLTENIGFVNTEPDRYYYLFVFASYFEGTEPKEFTLDYGLTSVIGENEPAEHAADATPVAITPGATNTITGTLNSAIDNDWYVFTMPQFDGDSELCGIHIEANSESETNGVWTEIYTREVRTQDGRSTMNLVSDKITTDPINVGIAPGKTVYLRVSSNKSIYDYDVSSAPKYTVTITTVRRPERGFINYVNGGDKHSYDGYGDGYRIEASELYADIAGQVVSGFGMGMGVNDVDLIVAYITEDGKEYTRHTSTYNAGNFITGITIPKAVGWHVAPAGNGFTDHHFDIGRVEVRLASDNSVLASFPVFQLVISEYIVNP